MGHTCTKPDPKPFYKCGVRGINARQRFKCPSCGKHFYLDGQEEALFEIDAAKRRLAAQTKTLLLSYQRIVDSVAVIPELSQYSLRLKHQHTKASRLVTEMMSEQIIQKLSENTDDTTRGIV
jgi:hypothetical protein